MRSRPPPGIVRRLTSWATVLVTSSLLAMPLAAQLTGYQGGGFTLENRALAPEPGWPHDRAELLALPHLTDAWLSDHFGFRETLVHANTRLRYALFHEAPTRRVLFGKRNRLFLSGTDETHPYSIITWLCGIDVTEGTLTATEAGIRTLLRASAADAPGALFVAIPSAPVLYAEDLPDWLAPHCQGPSPIARVIRRMDDDPALAERVIYPIQALIAAKQTGRVIPRYNFHWSGRGARAVAAMIAEQMLLLNRDITIPIVEPVAASDLSNMVSGLDLRDRIVVPDYPATDLMYCYARPECMPELAPAIAATVADQSRIISPRAGSRRLLLLSDSYGVFIAPWFAAWFGEVRHLSTNAIGRLSADDRALLREFLFHKYRPDNVIFLYHDSAVANSPSLVAELLWPAPSVASAH
jgi:hypothetical protein